jgi:hypothetical protein
LDWPLHTEVSLAFSSAFELLFPVVGATSGCLCYLPVEFGAQRGPSGAHLGTVDSPMFTKFG